MSKPHKKEYNTLITFFEKTPIILSVFSYLSAVALCEGWKQKCIEGERGLKACIPQTHSIHFFVFLKKLRNTQGDRVLNFFLGRVRVKATTLQS